MRKVFFESGSDYELSLSLADYLTLLDCVEKHKSETQTPNRFDELYRRLPKVAKPKDLPRPKCVCGKELPEAPAGVVPYKFCSITCMNGGSK